MVKQLGFGSILFLMPYSATVIRFSDGSFSLTELSAAEVAELRNSKMSCGPACLWYFKRSMGEALSVTAVPAPPCARPNGWTLKDLADSAKLMGLSATAELYQWTSLCRRIGTGKSAGILHVNGHHFVLIYVTPDQRIQVFDPAGLTHVSLREFRNHNAWDGVVLFVAGRDQGFDFSGHTQD